ncbi:MAG: serine hydrolase domain-containing protein [Reichenbachiella sp.]|uniref:serine hydrolase domain-containing protein n=1 Tax=Reichenbachiella sp. TaxID=2184521 RepID=UPI0032984765
MKSLLILILTIIVWGMLGSCSDDSPETQIQTAYTNADDFLETLDFSGSVLVRDGDLDLVRKGYGFADRSAEVLNSPELIYRIGSMTKAFTAMGIVLLKRDGLITSYDQPISDFASDFPYGDKITLRHLLTHHSGIPDYLYVIEDLAVNQGQFFSPDYIFEIVVESLSEDGLDFEPGANYSYSNSNYLMLGLLIENLSGMTYHEYLNLKINVPLGLEKTEKGPDVMDSAPYAKGYLNGVETNPYQMQLANSSGDLVSTIDDLEKWGDALMGEEFLTVAEKEEIFAAPYDEDGYYTVGFGWFTIKINGKIMYFHGGDIDGYTSLIGLLPESNSMIILLSNEEDKGEQRNLIQETLPKYEF